MEDPPFFYDQESLKVAYIAGSFFILFLYCYAKNTSKIAPQRVFSIDRFQ